MTDPHDATDFMKDPWTKDGAASYPPEVPTSRPTAARVYGLALGGKDNFTVDRQAATAIGEAFPEGLDIARQNRLFLYRAVRFLAEEQGLDQFIDLGSGLPTENNVHEVAQTFQPQARVVYTDNDPIALVHGRAMLVNDKSTAYIQADITDPTSVLKAPETRSLIDLSRPVGVLLFSIPHCVPDDDAARRAVRGIIDQTVPGSVLALSHIVATDTETAQDHTRTMSAVGLDWKTRLPAEVEAWLTGLEPIEPGLGDINDWRPGPHQPDLPQVAYEYQHLLGASQRTRRVHEYGGLLARRDRPGHGGRCASGGPTRVSPSGGAPSSVELRRAVPAGLAPAPGPNREASKPS